MHSDIVVFHQPLRLQHKSRHVLSYRISARKITVHVVATVDVVNIVTFSYRKAATYSVSAYRHDNDINCCVIQLCTMLLSLVVTRARCSISSTQHEIVAIAIFMTGAGLLGRGRPTSSSFQTTRRHPLASSSLCHHGQRRE